MCTESAALASFFWMDAISTFYTMWGQGSERKREKERARENERERDDCTEAAPTKKTRDPRKRGMSLC